MILNLPDPQIEFSANIFYWLLCEAMNNKRLPGDNYKGDTQKLTQTHLFYDLNALMNVEAVSLGKFDLLYHEGRLQGGYKNAASKFKSGSFKSASSSIFLLNDGDMVAGFDTQVKTDYAAAYKKATEFARRYFDCAASARNDALVQKTLYLISTDSSISDTQPFYICSDGSAKAKYDLGNIVDFESEAFLLGVWHFLVTSQRLQAVLEKCEKIKINSMYQQLNVNLTYSEIKTDEAEPDDSTAVNDESTVQKDEAAKESRAIYSCHIKPDLARRIKGAAIHVEKNNEQEEMREIMDAWSDGIPSEIDRDIHIIPVMENSDITLSRGIFFYLLERSIQTVHPKRDRNAARRLFLDLVKLTVSHDCEIRSEQKVTGYCHDKFRQFQILSSAHCLDDQEQINTFSARLIEKYEDVLCSMIEIRKKYFCSEEKNEALVVELIEFIKNDNNIDDNQEFFVCSDGSPMTKAELCDAEELEFEPFLLGVWHYVVSLLDSVDSADEYTFDKVFRVRYKSNGTDHTIYRTGDIISEQSELYVELTYLED